MFNKFGKFLIYISSFIPIYVMFTITIIFRKYDGEKNLKDLVLLNIRNNLFSIIILICMIVVSIVVIVIILNIKPDTRINNKIIKNSNDYVFSFFISYLIPIINTFLLDNNISNIIIIISYIFWGLRICLSDKLYECPIFFLLGYKLYSISDEIFLLSRFKHKDIFNDYLLDEINGYEIVRIAENLYIHKKGPNKL